MSGTLTTVWVSAAVSAVVGAAAHNMWQGAVRAVSVVSKRFAPDHMPLWEGSVSLSPQGSTTSNVRVHVACAPNRHLGRAEIDPDIAIPFLQEFFPSACQLLAWSSVRDSVRFQAPTGYQDGLVSVGKSGRVDLVTYLTGDATEDGVCVSIMQLLGPVAQMVT